jgi:hypothetical protein
MYIISEAVMRSNSWGWWEYTQGGGKRVDLYKVRQCYTCKLGQIQRLMRRESGSAWTSLLRLFLPLPSTARTRGVVLQLVRRLQQRSGKQKEAS